MLLIVGAYLAVTFESLYLGHLLSAVEKLVVVDVAETCLRHVLIPFLKLFQVVELVGEGLIVLPHGKLKLLASKTHLVQRHGLLGFSIILYSCFIEMMGGHFISYIKTH